MRRLLVVAVLALAALPASATATVNFNFYSLGSSGGNGAFDATFYGASADGTHVFFLTDESLVPADTDTSTDLYEATGGSVFLRSDSTAGGVDPNTPVSCCSLASAGAHKVSPSGRAFFETAEPLAPSTDTDSQTDVYATSSTANPIHVSRGQINGSGAFGATFDGSSDDGNRVFFDTAEQLAAGDTDSNNIDTYRWDVDTSSGNIATPVNSTLNQETYSANSADGTKLAFSTPQVLDGSDGDAALDLYQVDLTNSAITPISTDGADGSHTGDGSSNVNFIGASSTLDKVVFSTNEALTADDTDSPNPRIDLYVKPVGQVVQLATPSTPSANVVVAFAKVTPDGKVLFQDNNQICCSDTDSTSDVYQFASGTISRVSTSSTAGNATISPSLVGFSADGNHVFFSTTEQMTPSDTDSNADIFDRVGGASTVQVSQGQQNGNGAFDAQYSGSAADGSRIFFSSSEPLTSDDTDTRFDIFERSGGATSRISSGPNGGNAAVDVGSFGGTNAAGTRAYFTTAEHIFSTDTDSNQDLFGWELALNVPTVSSTASAGITLGSGTLSDTATVAGRVSPVAGATFDFKLYGPDDATCSGTPAFQSLGRAIDGSGGASSAAFTPTAAGTYRWRAFYSGDANNAAVSSACNATGQTTVVATPGSGGGGSSGGGGGGSGNGGGETDTVAPTITGYTSSHKLFRVGAAATPAIGVAARKAKPPVGTAFTYTLSEAASVKIDLRLAQPGRRQGAKCVKPSAKLHKAKHCTRFVSRGGLARTSHAGANRVAFTGRVGTRALRPGSYRAVLTATDGAGNRSISRTSTFKVVRG